jgi:ABC-2 type transport system permease protein
MSSIAPSPIYKEHIFNPATRSRSRFAIVSIAFWHTLRRDITITARWFFPFLMQVIVLPFSLLFVFGKILPGVGSAEQMYPALFLPGVIALTIFMASLQGASVALMLDLGENREIDDRLLAPLPVSLVAVEKVVFTAMRSLVAAALTFLLAYVVLGSRYQVRTDSLGLLIITIILYALSSAALGLVIGSAMPVDKIYLLFSFIFSATMYTGCVYYTWSSIDSIKPLQIISLFNPLTYASEGLRYSMVPLVNGQAAATLPIGWALLGLSVSFVVFLIIGIRIFRKKVIS